MGRTRKEEEKRVKISEGLDGGKGEGWEGERREGISGKGFWKDGMEGRG